MSTSRAWILSGCSNVGQELSSSHRHREHPGGHKGSCAEREGEKHDIQPDVDNSKGRPETENMNRKTHGERDRERSAASKEVSINVCCAMLSCVGLDSRLIANRGGNHPDESWPHDKVDPNINALVNPISLLHQAFKVFYSQSNSANRWQGAIRIDAGNICTIGGDSWTVVTSLPW